MTTQLLRLSLAAGVALMLATCAAAMPFGELVIFGDSLSDVGNIHAKSFQTVPGPAYFEGRFSDGPVYAELLAQGLGLPEMTPSFNGGNNFAHGGAMTSGTTGFPDGFIIDDIDEQVEDFVDNRTAQPDTLFLLFAGSNDLISGETDVNVPVGSLGDDIQSLYDAGMRHLLVLNLPRLGATPMFNSDPTAAAAIDQLSLDFNVALDAELDDLEANLDELNLLRFDTAILFDQVIADPASFGLMNVTDPAAPGLEPEDSDYDLDNIVDNPASYLFWDEVHPTATVHALLADELLQFLTPTMLAGDYNGSGTVDAADYAVWLAAIGQSVPAGSGADGNSNGVVDQGDYDFWKAHFGATLTSAVGPPIPHSAFPVPHSGAVPEPAAGMLLAIGVLALAERRTRASGKPARSGGREPLHSGDAFE